MNSRQLVEIAARWVATVMKNPNTKLPITLISSVPSGKLLPQRAAVQVCMMYRALAPRKAPRPINKYFVTTSLPRSPSQNPACQTKMAIIPSAKMS